MVGLLAAGLFVWWRHVPAPPIPSMLSLLPGGTVIVSQARVEMDGRRPVEVAATVYVPAYPGAEANLARAALIGYDHWRHRWRVFFFAPLPGVPMNLDAGAVLGRREVVVFPAYDAEGTVEYRVVGLRWGRAIVLRAARTPGRVEVTRGALVERASNGGARAFRWDGRAFRPAPAPPPIPPPLAWRYWYDRRGVVRSEGSVVDVVPGQLIRLARGGGGLVFPPIPDPNLDQLSGGFRARRPGTYRITIPDLATRTAPYQLIIRVRDEKP